MISRRALQPITRAGCAWGIRRPLSSVAKVEGEVQEPGILVETRPVAPYKNADVCFVTLNRPKQYNSLTLDTLEELQEALDDISRSQRIRAVVIRGSGKAFSAGHDLGQINKADAASARDIFTKCSKLMQSLQRVPQPVIAAVHGIATGAGAQLVAACDLAIASSAARFATSGVNLGLFCSTPSVPLSRNVPRKRAFEMLVTGDFIDANTAAEYGLVNQVVPPEKLEEATMELVEKIASKPAVAVQLGKQNFYAHVEKPLQAAYDLSTATILTNLQHPDAKEGIRAFVEKRKPAWNL